MDKKTAFALLALILLLGTFLRIYKLGEESFWLDESATVYASKQSASYILGNIVNTRVLVPEYFKDGGGEMPAYFLMSYYWTQLFGLSEFKLRFLPAIFGIASIFMIYLLGKELFNKETGLIAAFILAVNHQHINYSQEARMYSLLVLLAISSVYFLVKTLKGSDKNWIFYVLSVALMLYTHYLTFFILGFQGLFMLIYIKKYRKSLKKIFLAYLSIFLLYLPWITTLIRQFYESAPNSRFFGQPTLFSLAEVFIGFNSWVSPDWKTRIALRAMDFRSLPASGWVLVICILSIALLLGIAFLSGAFKKFDFKNSDAVLILLWLFVPVMVPFAISVLFPQHSIFKSVKYVLFASPAYYILASKGIYNLKRYALPILMVLALLSIVPLYSYYANPDKESWRELAVYLNDNRKGDELVLVNGPGNVLPLSYYYPDIENIKGVRNIGQAKEAVKNEKSVWLVYAMEKYYDPDNTIKGYLDSNYNLVKQDEFIGIRVFRFSKK